MSEPVNDHGPIRPVPDPHGEAALLLVESLLHTLLARKALSAAETLEVVQGALDAQIEICDDRGEDGSTPSTSIQLLSNVISTLSIDLGRGADPTDS